MSSNTNQGSVISQGDKSLRADVARSTFGVNGDGVKVGIISDSLDNLGGLAADIASGDLPSDIANIKDLASGGEDEGRAMAQLVYDIAPGASLLFRTGFESAVDFAQGIRDLVAAGAQIIVDDLGYYSEPFFQDGVVAQAVEDAIARDVIYLSAAGNDATQSYESVFRGVFNPFDTDYLWHDFDPGLGEDIFQSFTLDAGDSIDINFQWDQPFASAGGASTANDLDIFLLDANNREIDAGFDDNLGDDAFEFITFTNETNAAATYNLAFGQLLSAGGPTAGRVKYIETEGSMTDAEFFTNSATAVGHVNVDAALSVGAASYLETPAFGQTPPLPEEFTSLGGIPILFDAAGNRLANPVIRDAPDFTAVDNTNTTFFGEEDIEEDGFFNFSGTSAAAPHAAGVVALMLQARPTATRTEIEAALEATAIDMLTPGYDRFTGAGFIQADAAISYLLENTSGNTIFVDANNTIIGNAFFAGSLYVGSLLSNTDNTNNPNDVIQGTSDNDNVWAGVSGNDVIKAGAGNDIIGISAGNSVVTAGNGNDFVYTTTARSGSNTIDLGAGNDNVWVTTGNNTISGTDSNIIGLGTGVDVVRLADGDNVIYRTENRSSPESGRKDIITGSGNDYIQTGSGDDLIDGGAGLNTLLGEAGADTFVFRRGAYNFVSDFELGIDALKLDSLSFADLSFYQGTGEVAADAFLFVGAQSIGQIANTTVAALQDSSNFV